MFYLIYSSFKTSTILCACDFGKLNLDEICYMKGSCCISYRYAQLDINLVYSIIFLFAFIVTLDLLQIQHNL